MQISLLALFIYPILKKTLRTNRQNNCNLNLIRKVKKAIILALICVGTDIATLVLYFTVYWLLEINLIINLFVTIASFDCWKKLLWPWNINFCRIALPESESDATLSAPDTFSYEHHNQLTTVA